MIFFSDKIEKYIPPKKGKSHVLRIIRELIDFRPEHTNTNVAEALRFLTNVTKKRCTAFLMSDFHSPAFADVLKIAARKHDVVALQVMDPREAQLPDVGLVQFMDAESGEVRWIDTSDRAVRKNYELNYRKHDESLRSLFARAGVDLAVLQTDRSWVTPLSNLLKRRGAQ